MMRVVYFGTPDFAEPALRALDRDSEVDVVAVVTAPDRPSGRGQKTNPSRISVVADELGIQTLKPLSLKSDAFLEQLKALQADVFAVIAFRKLPEVVWRMPSLGTFNVHGSLLPDLRGAAPIQWAMAHGDRKTGVTSFLINDRIDEGAILDVIELGIDDNDAIGKVYQNLSNLASELCLRTVKGIFHGSYSPRNQQPSEELRPAPKIDRAFAELDTLRSAWMLHNRIRACDPFPGASLPCPDDKSLRIKLYQSNYHASPSSEYHRAVLEITDSEIKIQGENGYCSIGQIQYPGKKKMPVKDFLRGYRTRGNFEIN